MKSTKPTVWTIAGIDSSAKAGIYRDLQVFHDFDIEAQAIVTLLTAQNNQQISDTIFCDSNFISEQLDCLSQEKIPEVIKIGALGKLSSAKSIIGFLNDYKAKVVFDPVLASSSGYTLTDEKAYFAICKLLLPKTNLFTPNIIEANNLLNMTIQNTADMITAAHEFLNMGCSAVLMKGGHLNSEFSHDYFTDGKNKYWLNATRIQNGQMRGTGCCLSAAIAACLANAYEFNDALVKAKMYLHNKIRCSTSITNYNPIHTMASQENLPWISTQASALPTNFPSIEPHNLGLYPIVNSVEMVEYCLKRKVGTMQLRIKDKPMHEVEEAIAKSVALAKSYQARLFINDYWQFAIKYHAYGIHLGQSDLDSADLNGIKVANLRLGISTHCYYEIAKAHSFKPSYIAYGPIFHTTSKIMPFSCRGIRRLKKWCKGLNYPIVAIGGIKLDNYKEVLATGVDGIAFISAVKDFIQ